MAEHQPRARLVALHKRLRLKYIRQQLRLATDIIVWSVSMLDLTSRGRPKRCRRRFAPGW
jgi:hypothetical protein